MKEGRTKKEAIRCLKRYVAREAFAQLPRSALALDNPQPAARDGLRSSRPASCNWELHSVLSVRRRELVLSGTRLADPVAREAAVHLGEPRTGGRS